MIAPANFEHVNNQDVSVYGKHTTLKCVNPLTSRFIATYPDGRIIQSPNIIHTGWDDIPHGLCKLTYVLSTGHVINIPKDFIAYKPLIEVSIGMDNSRIYHSIDVNCLDTHRVVIYRIILKESNNSRLKIGDIVIKEATKPVSIDKSWKYIGG